MPVLAKAILLHQAGFFSSGETTDEKKRTVTLHPASVARRSSQVKPLSLARFRDYGVA